MSEIDDLVREQDRRWDPQPGEPRWHRDAKNMEAWPPHVPRRVWDADREWSLYELAIRQGGNGDERMDGDELTNGGEVS